MKGVNIDMTPEQFQKVLTSKGYDCGEFSCSKGEYEENLVRFELINEEIEIDGQLLELAAGELYYSCSSLNSCNKTRAKLKDTLVKKFKNLECEEFPLYRYVNREKRWSDKEIIDDYELIKNKTVYHCLNKNGIELFIDVDNSVYVNKNKYLNADDQKRLEKLKNDDIDLD